MKLLRANTAVDVLIGPFVDDSDGNTDETGLTISQADVRLSKNGQNMAQKNDANACTHDELGYYNCPLDATDTNTEGQLDIIVHESGALHVKMECMILSEAAYDSLFTAKDDGFMDVNIKTIGRADTQETETDNLESACSNYSVTRGLSGTALPAAAADAAGGLPISDTGGLDLDTLLGRLTGNVATAAKLLAYIQLLARSDAAIETDNATELTEINADGGSGAGNYSAQTDAGEAVRDHIGNGANLTEAGGDGDHLTEAGGDGDHLTEAGGTGDQLTALATAANLAVTDGKVDTIDSNVDSVLADTGTDGVVVAAASKTGYALSDAGVDAIFDRNSSLSISFETLIERIYQILNNKLTIVDATGGATLRNLADSGDLATWTINDDDTDTVRTGISWA